MECHKGFERYSYESESTMSIWMMSELVRGGRELAKELGVSKILL